MTFDKVLKYITKNFQTPETPTAMQRCTMIYNKHNCD